MKKATILLLFLAMVFSITPTVFAADGDTLVLSVDLMDGYQLLTPTLTTNETDYIYYHFTFYVDGQDIGTPNDIGGFGPTTITGRPE